MSRFATIADTPAISQLLLAFAAEARVGFRDSTSAVDKTGTYAGLLDS